MSTTTEETVEGDILPEHVTDMTFALQGTLDHWRAQRDQAAKMVLEADKQIAGVQRFIDLANQYVAVRDKLRLRISDLKAVIDRRTSQRDAARAIIANVNSLGQNAYNSNTPVATADLFAATGYTPTPPPTA